MYWAEVDPPPSFFDLLSDSSAFFSSKGFFRKDATFRKEKFGRGDRNYSASGAGSHEGRAGGGGQPAKRAIHAEGTRSGHAAGRRGFDQKNRRRKAAGPAETLGSAGGCDTDDRTNEVSSKSAVLLRRRPLLLRAAELRRRPPLLRAPELEQNWRLLPGLRHPKGR